MLLQELVTSCFLIVAAEMGDKSQILAMTFATRYTIRQVMLGVFFGILLNHGIAVALGTSLSLIISLDIVRALAGVVFVIFALLTLAKMDEDDLESTNNHRYGHVATVSMAVFISELGTKTQLATITLASSSQYPCLLAGIVSAWLSPVPLAFLSAAGWVSGFTGICYESCFGVVFFVFWPCLAVPESAPGLG